VLLPHLRMQSLSQVGIRTLLSRPRPMKSLMREKSAHKTRPSGRGDGDSENPTKLANKISEI
jgi:hypothetical protein